MGAVTVRGSIDFDWHGPIEENCGPRNRFDRQCAIRKCRSLTDEIKKLKGAAADTQAKLDAAQSRAADLAADLDRAGQSVSETRIKLAESERRARWATYLTSIWGAEDMAWSVGKAWRACSG